MATASSIQSTWSSTWRTTSHTRDGVASIVDAHADAHARMLGRGTWTRSHRAGTWRRRSPAGARRPRASRTSRRPWPRWVGRCATASAAARWGVSGPTARRTTDRVVRTEGGDDVFGIDARAEQVLLAGLAGLGGRWPGQAVVEGHDDPLPVGDPGGPWRYLVDPVDGTAACSPASAAPGCCSGRVAGQPPSRTSRSVPWWRSRPAAPRSGWSRGRRRAARRSPSTTTSPDGASLPTRSCCAPWAATCPVASSPTVRLAPGSHGPIGEWADRHLAGLEVYDDMAPCTGGYLAGLAAGNDAAVLRPAAAPRPRAPRGPSLRPGGARRHPRRRRGRGGAAAGPARRPDRLHHPRGLGRVRRRGGGPPAAARPHLVPSAAQLSGGVLGGDDVDQHPRARPRTRRRWSGEAARGRASGTGRASGAARCGTRGCRRRRRTRPSRAARASRTARPTATRSPGWARSRWVSWVARHDQHLEGRRAPERAQHRHVVVHVHDAVPGPLLLVRPWCTAGTRRSRRRLRPPGRTRRSRRAARRARTAARAAGRGGARATPPPRGRGSRSSGCSGSTSGRRAPRGGPGWRPSPGRPACPGAVPSSRGGPARGSGPRGCRCRVPG